MTIYKVFFTTGIVVSVFAVNSCSRSSTDKVSMNGSTVNTSVESGKEDIRNAEIDNVKDSSNSNDATILNAQNMVFALKDEAATNFKYVAYSKKAEEEGYHEIAMLFSATALSKKIQCDNRKLVFEEVGQTIPTVMQKYEVKSTLENLKEAILSENLKDEKMYPEFLDKANFIGDQISFICFDYAFKSGKRQVKLFRSALSALESNTAQTISKLYFVCPTCGSVDEGEAPKYCHISMTKSDKFIKITK